MPTVGAEATGAPAAGTPVSSAPATSAPTIGTGESAGAESGPALGRHPVLLDTPPPYHVPGQHRTPRPQPHGIPLATPGARLVARLIDIAAILALALVANSWFLYQLGRELAPLFAESMRGVQPVISEEVSGRVQTLSLLVCVVTAAVWLAYEVPALASTGQTPGKRALGIKVMRMESPEHLGAGRALRRWITLGMPTLLWTCCCFGFLMQFLDCLYVAIDQHLHQAVHDRSARTVVVHIGRAESRTAGNNPQGGSL